MPRTAKPSTDPLGSTLNALVALFTDALVAGAKAAIANGQPADAAPTTKRGPGRPKKSAPTPASPTRDAAAAKRGPGRPPKYGGKPCLVPRCGKKTVAKGLCQGHYRKAVRLGVAMKLDKANLAKLAKDGRATRWAKKR